MSTRVVNGILLVMLATAGVLAWTIRKDPAKPNIEIMPEMARSVPYDSFAPNDVLVGGATLQAAPAHVVARGDADRPRYAATREDAMRAGVELTNPFTADDAEAARRGAQVFRTYCAPCHGLGGMGDGTIVGRGYPAPPPFRTPERRALADGTIFHVITYGTGNMPAHGAQIPEDDRWKAVLHVRTLMVEP